MTHAHPRAAAREVQSALDINVAIKLNRMLLIWMMNTRRKMNHCVHADERVLPVNRWADRLDYNVVGSICFGPQRAADNPSTTFQYRFKMAADETAGTGYKDHRPAVLHEMCPG
jgi:hypothetical protein